MASADFRNVNNSDDFVNLSEVSPRDEPWDTHRAQADAVGVIYSSAVEFERYAARISQCSGYLKFGECVDVETGECFLRLRSARFCRVRNCPVCQWRRSLMWQARFYQHLPTIQAAHPSARWLLLTLTVRNCEVTELSDTIKSMNEAWKRLTLRKEFKRVFGWVRTTEVTRGKDNSAHPHFHCLLLVPPSWFKNDYVSHARWVEIWQECARLSYLPNVDIRAVKPKRSDLTASDAITGAVQEVLKYAVKPSDMVEAPDWFLAMTKQVHRKRFIAAGGVLKDVLKLAQETEEDLLLGTEQQSEADDDVQVFTWNGSAKRYRRQR